MKLNKQGINIDEGLPLEANEALNILHLDLYPQQSIALTNWLANQQNKEAITVSGQIGSGKSTLINKCIQNCKIKPDIWLKLDKDINSPTPTQGDFIYIIIAAMVKLIADRNITATKSIELQKDFTSIFKQDINSWHQLSCQLNPDTPSLSELKKQQHVINAINSDANTTYYFLNSIKTLIDDFIISQNRAPLIIASGIDKYNSKNTAYFAMQNVLDCLSAGKILYEINTIHLFAALGQKRFIPNSIPLTTVEQDEIIRLLKRRLGIYANKYQLAIEMLAQYSGGNPRQAIRLLLHFLDAKKDRKLNHAEHIAIAVKKTSIDYFAYANRPSNELIKTVEKDKFILSATISAPNDINTGLQAIYANWILLGPTIQNDKHTCIINPLVIHEFDGIKPTDALHQKLNDYAKQHDISPEGLNIDPQSKNAYLALNEQLDHFIDSNVNTVLDSISTALYSTDRADRVFIAYHHEQMCQAARSYILAKSNSFEQQSFYHQTIQKSLEYTDPVTALESLLIEVQQKSIDILSIEFDQSWTIDELASLEGKRDKLINCQLLWWCTKTQLQALLPAIPQLRQFFEIFSLDDELHNNLTIEQLKNDIALFEQLDETDNVITKELIEVANYIKKAKGNNHG